MQTLKLCSTVLLVSLMAACMLLAHLYSVSLCEFEPSDSEPVLCKAAGRLQSSSWQILKQFISILHRKWGVDNETVHKL